MERLKTFAQAFICIVPLGVFMIWSFNTGMTRDLCHRYDTFTAQQIHDMDLKTLCNK